MSVNENMPRFECGVGIWNGPHVAEDAQNELISKFKEQIEKKCGKTFPHLKAISFKRQIYTGNNYIIKVEAGNEYIHVRLDDKIVERQMEKVLVGVQLGKTLEDDIINFND